MWKIYLNGFYHTNNNNKNNNANNNNNDKGCCDKMLMGISTRTSVQWDHSENIFQCELSLQCCTCSALSPPSQCSPSNFYFLRWDQKGLTDRGARQSSGAGNGQVQGGWPLFPLHRFSRSGVSLGQDFAASQVSLMRSRFMQSQAGSHFSSQFFFLSSFFFF